MMPFISFDRSVQELGFEFRDGSVWISLQDLDGMSALISRRGSEFEEGVLFSSDMSSEAEAAFQAALALAQG
jgi:hypothetical protein